MESSVLFLYEINLIVYFLFAPLKITNSFYTLNVHQSVVRYTSSIEYDLILSKYGTLKTINVCCGFLLVFISCTL